MVFNSVSIPWLFDSIGPMSWLILSTVKDIVDFTNSVSIDTVCSIYPKQLVNGEHKLIYWAK